MKLARAQELMTLIGSAGNMFLPKIDPASPYEDAEIKGVWKKMSGSSCYYSAICKIVEVLETAEKAGIGCLCCYGDSRPGFIYNSNGWMHCPECNPGGKVCS